MNKTLLCFLVALSFPIYAIDYSKLSTPEKQQAYEELTSELRCLVCQNQTIADSNADLAADLRRQVYEMLEKGQSKQDVQNFMTQRYGDFVLYNPPFKAKTSLLWLGPALFLLTGVTSVYWLARRRKQMAQATNTHISNEKQRKIKKLLEEGDGS